MEKLFTFFAIAFPLSFFAQELPYTLSTWNETYQELENPTILTDVGVAWDDPQLFIDLGFNFEMMGESFSSIISVDPGVILFPAIEENELNLFCPYNADIISAGYPDTSYSSISYEVTGPPGNRICKIQWKDVAFYYEVTGFGTWINQTNFQLWLYETTNDFEYRYGENTIKSGDVIHDFGVPLVLVAKNLNFNTGQWETLWMLNGDPANPGVINYYDPDVEPTAEQLLDGEPPAGQVYHFDTGIVGTNEIVPVSAFRIYPAVAENFIIAEFNSPQEAVMKIFDVLGNEVNIRNLSNGVSVIDVSGFAPGTYLICISEGNEFHSMKFIKS